MEIWRRLDFQIWRQLVDELIQILGLFVVLIAQRSLKTEVQIERQVVLLLDAIEHFHTSLEVRVA